MLQSRKTDALGKQERVRLRLEKAIWKCFSGPGQTDALGVKAAWLLLRQAIWRCCSGPEQTDALGMQNV